MAFEDLMDGWQNGTVDASWYCVDCWDDYFHNERGWEGNTREHSGLPPASRPSTIRDQRFSDKSVRWAYSDRCGAYFRGRARDYLYGSFVYGYAYNKVAGPGCRRSSCFPKTDDRRKLWETGQWNAAYACRACLPIWWKQPEPAVSEWLRMDSHQGAYNHVHGRQGRQRTRHREPRDRSPPARRRTPERRRSPDRRK